MTRHASLLLTCTLGLAVAPSALAEFGPGDTLSAYRERTLAQRLGRLDTGTPEQKQQMCEGALAMLSGTPIPGEWPPRE